MRIVDRQVRNAIQALQMLACSPQSNPNLPTPAASHGSGVLARSSSHPPDAICWNPPARLIDMSTQTDWPVDLFETWVRANPRRALKALGLDPNVVLRLPPPSPTPSPSSPPPPPYEPLSPLTSSPQQSSQKPSRSLTTGNYIMSVIQGGGGGDSYVNAMGVCRQNKFKGAH